MDNLISRNAAIDAIADYLSRITYTPAANFKHTASWILARVPSVQTKNINLIDRQTAIDAFKDHASDWDDDYHVPLDVGIEILDQLPPANPEIVRCKDCLMHGVCRFEQGLGLNGYCSQAERRKNNDN